MPTLVSGREVVDAEDGYDVVEVDAIRRPLDAGRFEERDLPHPRRVLSRKLAEHPRCLVHRRDLGIGHALEDVGEFQAGAAADVEDSKWFPCHGKLRGDGAVQAVGVDGELGIPEVGDRVEEVRQALDVVADAAGVAQDTTGFAQTLELLIEGATIIFDRHTFSVTA